MPKIKKAEKRKVEALYKAFDVSPDSIKRYELTKKMLRPYEKGLNKFMLGAALSMNDENFGKIFFIDEMMKKKLKVI